MCDSPTGASLSHFDLRLRRRPGTPGTGHKRTWTTIHAVVNSEFTGNNITACNVLTSQAGAYEVCFPVYGRLEGLLGRGQTARQGD